MSVRKFVTRQQRIAETLRRQHPDKSAEEAMVDLLHGHMRWLKEDIDRVCRPIQEQLDLDEETFQKFLGAAMLIVCQELWPQEQQKCS